MNIIIDSRMRKEEKKYLLQYGNLVQLQTQECVYEEISAHPDIFFCKVDNKLFECPGLNMNIGKIGSSTINSKYPNDVKYNLCQIGKNIVHNFNYTDLTVLKYIDSCSLNKIQVNQGYSNCSITVISENSCITSDEGIYKTLKNQDIDCLYFSKNSNIHLIKKDKTYSKMQGFIGGATAVINDTFILFGDSKYLKEKEKLLKFLDKYNLKFKDFKNLEIIDYGGIICF